MQSNIGMFFAGLCTAILVAGCGGDESVPATDSGTAQISGAGIKGPLAFADVKIYALDPSFADYYDKTSPISITMTNQYAEINGLSIPRKIKPPYILTIDGRNGIDLNTGVAPVIDTLITVVTEDMLANERPIFATPLTTLVYHMARLSDMARLGNIRMRYKKNSVARITFLENINNATNLVSRTFVIGQDRDIDLFRSPLVINEYTTDLVEQEQAVYHRAAVEAFATKVYALALLGNISSDNIIERLALDFYNDGFIDNSVNGTLIGSIDPMVLSQDPMKLLIPNTPYHIEEIMLLMEEERIFIGTSMGPDFLVDEIAFPEVSTNTDTGNTYTDNTYTDNTYSDSIPTESAGTETTVLPEPVVTLSVDRINFGSQHVDETSDPIELVLTNSGTAPLNISDISTSSGFIEANNCSNYLPSGGNCIIDVQFVPATIGDITGKLTIVSDATTSSDFASLSGTSIGIDGDLLHTNPLSIYPDSPDNIFYNNFNSEIQHTYTLTDLQDFWGVRYARDLNDAVDIVADPDPSGTHNNVMRVFYAGDNYGFHDGSGAQWRKNFSGHDELYLAYDVFFEDDAEFVKGGKLPRLHSTGYEGHAGTAADGTDLWSAGLVWSTAGMLCSYVYHAEQSRGYGDKRCWNDGVDGQVYFQPGKWHSVEIRVVMNTPGVLDGRMQGWFDGKLAFDSSEFMWRMPGGEHLDIGQLFFSTFYGGGNSTWAPSTDQHTYFDNFVISTQPITH